MDNAMGARSHKAVESEENIAHARIRLVLDQARSVGLLGAAKDGAFRVGYRRA
jgi:hypothetical protein